MTTELLTSATLHLFDLLSAYFSSDPFKLSPYWPGCLLDFLFILCFYRVDRSNFCSISFFTRERFKEGVRCSWLIMLSPLWAFCFSSASGPAAADRTRAAVLVLQSGLKKSGRWMCLRWGSMCDFPTAFKLWLNASLAFQSWQWWLNVDDGWSPVQRPLRDGTFYTDYCTRHVGREKSLFQVSNLHVDGKIVSFKFGTSILSFSSTFAHFRAVTESFSS